MSIQDDDFKDNEPLLLETNKKSKFFKAKWQEVQKYFTPEHDFKYYLHPKNSILLLLTISVILVGTINRIFFKKMTVQMNNYPYFVSQLTSFVYLPVFWPIVWYLMLFTKRITPEMQQFPWWKV